MFDLRSAFLLGVKLIAYEDAPCELWCIYGEAGRWFAIVLGGEAGRAEYELGATELARLLELPGAGMLARLSCAR